MLNPKKFAVRRDWYDFSRWLVVAPGGQTEVLDNFPDAIAMLDLWIEECRCRIVGRERSHRDIARA